MPATLARPKTATKSVLSPILFRQADRSQTNHSQTRLHAATPLSEMPPPGRSSGQEPHFQKGRAPVPETSADPRRPLGLSQVPVHNRVRILLVHIPFLSIRGQARLAADIASSPSAISRLVTGRVNPSYRLARAVTDALERRLGRPLDIREVFSLDGTYPTQSGCALCRCRGCLPASAWGMDSVLKPEWQDAQPGDWSLAIPSRKEIEKEETTGKESR
ncbi:MAG: hypothetical protein ACRYFS_19730 [Janthinobacterium lividum]